MALIYILILVIILIEIIILILLKVVKCRLKEYLLSALKYLYLEARTLYLVGVK